MKEKAMKHVKFLGLLAIAAAALMAFASSASATTITSPTGTTFTSKLIATSTNSSLDGAFTTVSCKKSTVEGNVEQHGTSVTARGKNTSLTFSECNFPVKVEAAGSEIWHAIRPNIQPHTTCLSTDTDTCLGTVTSTEAKVTIETSVGNCTFTTNETSVGTLTTTSTTKGNAVLDISGTIPRTGGNFLCGSSGTWTGSYTINTPSSLWVDE
jgi:hypothetical protein